MALTGTINIMITLQAGTFILLLDGEDSDEKAVTAMGILNTLETMLNAMEGSKEVLKKYPKVKSSKLVL